jgi:hypothetical protein
MVGSWKASRIGSSRSSAALTMISDAIEQTLKTVVALSSKYAANTPSDLRIKVKGLLYIKLWLLFEPDKLSGG